MQVTATEAKNRFGDDCGQAKADPGIVEKDGRIDTVLVDHEQSWPCSRPRPPSHLTCANANSLIPAALGSASRTGILSTNLCPRVIVRGKTLSITPHLAAPLAARALKRPVAGLTPRARQIAAAMDAVFSGI